MPDSPERAPLRSVCVYCASSRRCDPLHHRAAGELGRHLADAGLRIVYGGGAVGSMGALADAALAAGGEVLGVLPAFMNDLEWGHGDISELVIVDDMHERKKRMLAEADAVVALPGGTGTLEELVEALTWKRLGLHAHPIVIVDVEGYYGPLLEAFERMVTERFMDERHREMWSVVERPADVLEAIRTAPVWDADARGFAVP
ncbi:MAG: TIGR00730 family Rossman fold protein [Planctomycetota bacterium]